MSFDTNMMEPSQQGSVFSALILVIIAAIIVVCVVVAIFTHKIRRTERQAARQKAMALEVASRRRISPKMKQAILERDNYTCQICGISRGFLDHFIPGLGDYLLLEIDHIDSVANGGTGKDEDNLQVLCWRCNRKKGGDKTNEDVADTINYGMKYLHN